jgi:hypothetical protein
MTEDDIAERVARSIAEAAGVKVTDQLPLTDEQLAELEERRQKFRHYWHRQDLERKQRDEAERIAADCQAQEAERRRVAEANEALKRRLREKVNQPSYTPPQQPSNIDARFAAFEDRLAQAQRQQQRRNWLRQWESEVNALTGSDFKLFD